MMFDPAATHLALRNQLLTVTGLPTAAWSNVDTTPTQGQPYIEEAFAPSGGQLRTLNARNGISEKRGLYIVRWYGVENADAMGIETGVASVLAKFTPGTALAVGGDRLLIRGDVEPWAGAVVPQGDGWAVCTITIPWKLDTRNTVAA